MNHRGKILRKVVDRYCNMHKSTISHIAHEAGYDQSTIYRHFDKADLAFHILRKYGKVLHYDFGVDYPELIEEQVSFLEDVSSYGRFVQDELATDECRSQLAFWQMKYIKLLEQHNDLLVSKLSGGKP